MADTIENIAHREKRALFGALPTFRCNLMMQKENKISSAGKRADNPTSYQKLEDVVGCKWSVSVLQCVGKGITRPGALEREISGISTKVLSERLRKLTAYGLLGKQTFPEVPPRTEYALTDSGMKLLAIINQIRVLDEGIRGGAK